jgi:hypothetical protein
MQVKPWRVAWYGADRLEIDTEDFVHENLARRKIDRVKEGRLGRSVRLYRMHQTEEATAVEFPYGGWELVREWEIP